MLIHDGLGREHLILSLFKGIDWFVEVDSPMSPPKA